MFGKISYLLISLISLYNFFFFNLYANISNKIKIIEDNSDYISNEINMNDIYKYVNLNYLANNHKKLQDFIKIKNISQINFAKDDIKLTIIANDISYEYYIIISFNHNIIVPDKDHNNILKYINQQNNFTKKIADFFYHRIKHKINKKYKIYLTSNSLLSSSALYLALKLIENEYNINKIFLFGYLDILNKDFNNGLIKNIVTSVIIDNDNIVNLFKKINKEEKFKHLVIDKKLDIKYNNGLYLLEEDIIDYKKFIKKNIKYNNISNYHNNITKLYKENYKIYNINNYNDILSARFLYNINYP